MHSEFQHVELNQVRYSLVWEDYITLYSSLQYDKDDHLLIITSAGCNVLNSLLRPLASVTAIDINPVQNALLALKIHTIRNFDYHTFASILGLNEKEAVIKAWMMVKKTLPENEVRFWEPYFESDHEGLLLFGKLERYILSFRKLLDDEMKSAIRQLLTFDHIKDQYDYFINHLDKSPFRSLFINFFNEQNLSKGRDTKLFKYAEEPAGETFYARLVQYVKTFPLKNSFYFRFFFFGLDQPRNLLPPCYQEKNFSTIKSKLDKIKIVQREAIEFLLSQEADLVTKASFSNIFEYTSHEEFNIVCQKLAERRPSLQFVYWNLLQEQVVTPSARFEPAFLDQNSSSCFYFKNACVMRMQNVYNSR